MKLLQLFLLSLLATQADAAERHITPNRCYSTVADAEVAKEPGKEPVGVLAKGRTVRVKGSAAAGWLRIEYSRSGANVCPPKGDVEVGWVPEGTLGSYTAPLSRLLKEKRVVIAGESLNVFGDGVKYLLGERVTVIPNDTEDDTAGGRLKLREELPVNIYCLGKGRTSNKVVSGTYDWGGDAGAYNEKLVTGTKLPKGECIIVNGAIDTEGTARLESPPVTSPLLCSKKKKGELFQRKDYFCTEKHGVFADGGSTYVIVKEGVTGRYGPSLTEWRLYEIQDSGKARLLGGLGSAGGP